jgi:hypothetical protein
MWNIPGNALWAIPFTVNPGLFSNPLRVNGMGAFRPPP